MPPNSATNDKILDYTMVAANALSDVAVATQIPFLSRVCTLTLMIIPMVQVWRSNGNFATHWLIRNAEQQGSKRPMPPDCRGESSFALCAPKSLHPLEGHSIPDNAPPNSSVCCVSQTSISDLLLCIHFVSDCRTLQKFESCLRAQQELGTIRRLFKKSEVTAQLDSCETELKVALSIFTVSQ
jgi:hypothetical protein